MRLLRYPLALALVFASANASAHDVNALAEPESAPRPTLEMASRESIVSLHKGSDAEPPAEVRFPVVNAGELPLHIEAGSVSCGCTKLEVTAEELLPGDEAEVVLTLNTAEFRADRSVVAVLKTNDPEAPEVRLSHAVRWIDMLEATPREGNVHLGKLGKGAAARRELTVKRHFGDMPLDVELVSPVDPRFVAELPEANNAQRTYAISFRAAEPLGPFRDTLTLRVNAPEKKEFAYIITGIVVGDLDASPWQINLGQVPQGTERSRRVWITPMGEAQLNRAETDMSGVSLVLSTVGKRSAVDVNFVAGKAPGPIDGQIVLISDSGERSALRVTGEVVAPIQPRALQLTATAQTIKEALRREP